MLLALLPTAVLAAACRDRLGVTSEVLGERRSILAHLPPEYGDPGRRFPVLYHLDAYAPRSVWGPSFSEEAEAVDRMLEPGVPRFVQIGIENTDRGRDMLPCHSDVLLSSGGADTFLRFVADELVPTVNDRFRTTSERVIYGRSDSGLFVIYALVSRPAAFSGYIAAAPTVGHCPDLILSGMVRLLASPAAAGRSLFMISYRHDRPLVVDWLPDLAQRVETLAAPGFRHEIRVLDGRGHVPGTALTDGLRFLYGPRVQGAPSPATVTLP